MRYNLHTHTYRCHHADGEDREYVENAIKAGISVLGFSDHSPYFFKKDGYYSNFRMTPAETEGYVKSVRSLQKEYAGDIKILLGLETEYYPETFETIREFLKPYELDYMILGQHFIGSEYDAADFEEPDGKRGLRFLNQYVNQVSEGIKTGAFTYIAHPDIVDWNGTEKFNAAFEQKLRELCELAKQLDIPVEYNMLGMIRKKNYPSRRFWKIVKETGNKVVIGYDAHTPKALLNEDSFNKCKSNLKDFGIETVEFEEINLRSIN